MFSREKRLKKQLKEAEKNNRTMQRELERDRNQLKLKEVQLKNEIRRLALQGDKKSCSLLAKQLVNNREQVAKSKEIGLLMNDALAQQRVCASNVRIAKAAETTTSMMAKMNRRVEKSGSAQAMQKYSKEMMKMSNRAEAMNEALSYSFDDSEENAVIHQVLDELGLELSEKLPNASTRSLGSTGVPVADQDNIDITEQLERLRRA
ncbi:charged multivesicular body protein 2b [Echinococcus multilocularis]|uniref:Charged multivesicular body protein 2b n=1 Tax=Echinococcus multilocularis TaxID=6211 RepID=A0A068XU68_ECHMU|nr:charged multivesicular body protein 2b [Echinococcus multilocularis]